MNGVKEELLKEIGTNCVKLCRSCLEMTWLSSVLRCLPVRAGHAVVENHNKLSPVCVSLFVHVDRRFEICVLHHVAILVSFCD